MAKQENAAVCRWTWNRWGAAALAAALAWIPGSPAAQKIPRADSVVKPKSYVSADMVPRGMAFEIAVVAEVAPGFHINSNRPNEDYLIPTEVKAETPAGIQLQGTTYPKAKSQKFEFSDTKLAVYDGRVVVVLKLGVALDAPLGAMKIPMTLKYQACNDYACLPPVKLPVSAELSILVAGAKARFVNQQIFQRK